MGTTAPSIRPFNALNGLEIKKIILAEIDRHLSQDYRFAQHLTYPVVTWAWKLAVNAYPMDSGQFQVEIGPKVAKAPGAEMPAEGAESVEIDFTGGKNVAPTAMTPDAARRGAALPVSTPRAVPGPEGKRMIVDAPVIATGSAQAPVETSEARVETNVSAGGPVFARRVVQRTAASPEGVEALPQAGTRPSTEDVQKILDRDAAKEKGEEGKPAEP